MTMTTQNAVAPPPTAAARRYTQQITALVDEQTKEYLLGLAIADADAAGQERPKEGEQIRRLLDQAIADRYASDPRAYEHAVLTGRRELAARAAHRTQDAA